MLHKNWLTMVQGVIWFFCNKRLSNSHVKPQIESDYLKMGIKVHYKPNHTVELDSPLRFQSELFTYFLTRFFLHFARIV